MHNYHVKYVFTRMPGNKIIKLWCHGGMVRAIAVVRDGVPTREVADICNVPINYTLMRYIAKGHYISLQFYNNDAIIYQCQSCIHKS